MATKSPKQKPAEPPNQKPTDKGNAPALRGIFTAEQVTLLESYLPKYLLIKREPGKKFIDFWGPLLQDFFFNHPLADLTPEELASGVDQGNRVGERQAKVQKVCERISFVYSCGLLGCQRIKEWFNNHTKTATSGGGRRKLLDLAKNTSSRMLAPYQAYGRMNKKNIGLIIDKEWSDDIMSKRHTDDERVKPVPPVPINFRNSVLKRLLAAEPVDVQDAVDVWRRENRPGEKEDSVKGDGDFDQAEAYYQ